MEGKSEFLSRRFDLAFPIHRAEKFPSLKVKAAAWTEKNIVKRQDAT